MRQLLPGLKSIEVGYTPSRTLGLYFHESGFGRPWTVAEISDGTIHSLALLVALYDPRAAMLVLEEPENSVHTWILRALMEAAIEAARSKQIVLTTHSRVVIDSTKPSDVWVMWRNRGESGLAQLSALDADLLELIEEGDLTMFEFLDTGTIPEALPPAPEF
jgi:predicted ATPase